MRDPAPRNAELTFLYTTQIAAGEAPTLVRSTATGPIRTRAPRALPPKAGSLK